eukprot:1779016-Rhodomonas_salina.2
MGWTPTEGLQGESADWQPSFCLTGRTRQTAVHCRFVRARDSSREELCPQRQQSPVRPGREVREDGAGSP